MKKTKKEFIDFLKILNNFNIENLLNVEHIISLSKNTQRLNITLTYNDTIVKQKPIKNIIGIDIGGSFDNALALSSNEFKGFKHLYKIIKKLDKIDSITPKNNKEEKSKGNKLAKILRENEFWINKKISKILDDCEKNEVFDLVFEKLDPWNMKFKNKKINQKYNRIFRLIRSSGLVDLFRKQARNRGIRIHTVPAYYSSQYCSKCKTVSRKNRKSQKNFKCINCGHMDNADFNASKNLITYFERFSKELLTLNKFQEFEPKKFISKEFVKNLISS